MNKSICLLLFLYQFIAMENGFANELGRFPLCEASAASITPCNDRKQMCLLIGDNEFSKGLFQFPIHGHKLKPDDQRILKFSKKWEIEDIEALAQLEKNEFLAFGSFSRNSRCQKQKHRRRYALIQTINKESRVIEPVKSKAIRCERLFGKSSGYDEIIASVCQRIDQLETEADLIEKDLAQDKLSKKKAKQLCNQLSPYNAEGAVAIPDVNGAKIWIGLRAPLLKKHPVQPMQTNLAILLRLKNRNSYQFDSVSFLNLKGQGIRDLAIAGDTIWVIAGPAEDREEKFTLSRFPIAALHHGAVIEPDIARELPVSSEGLAIMNNNAWLVIDGGTGKKTKNCKIPSRFEQFTLTDKK